MMMVSIRSKFLCEKNIWCVAATTIIFAPFISADCHTIKRVGLYRTAKHISLGSISAIHLTPLGRRINTNDIRIVVGHWCGTVWCTESAHEIHNRDYIPYFSVEKVPIQLNK